MREAVEKTVDALFKLEDLRQIWRDTAPEHGLSADQTARAARLLEAVKDDADAILGMIGSPYGSRCADFRKPAESAGRGS